MKDRPVSSRHLSNCIVEAIAAKIRNWRGVRIGFYYKNFWRCKFHAYWTENGMFYDFTHAYEPSEPVCTLLFNGCVRECDKDRWDLGKRRNEPMNKGAAT